MNSPDVYSNYQWISVKALLDFSMSVCVRSEISRDDIRTAGKMCQLTGMCSLEQESLSGHRLAYKSPPPHKPPSSQQPGIRPDICHLSSLIPAACVLHTHTHAQSLNPLNPQRITYHDSLMLTGSLWKNSIKVLSNLSNKTNVNLQGSRKHVKIGTYYANYTNNVEALK